MAGGYRTSPPLDRVPPALRAFAASDRNKRTWTDGEYALTAAYETKAKATVADQLGKAGVRLASLLNRALSP